MFFRKHNVLYLHVPKTGGTSVEHSLISLEHTKLDEDALSGWSQEHGWLEHLTPREIMAFRPDLLTQAPMVFTIVRNPWDRMVSEYFWKSSITSFPFSFSEFVNTVYNEDHKYLFRFYKSEKAYFQHIRPQMSFMDSDLQIKIFRFEEFLLVEKFLKTVFNDFTRLPKVRTSLHNHYRFYYTQDLMEKVREIYKMDVEEYGYSFY